METIALSHLKNELSLLPAKEIVEICMKLARYKKENKELLHYLLFHAHDEPGYVSLIKKEITLLFEESPIFNLYLSKKNIRKILKITNKYIRYSKIKQTEVELLLHFCLELKKSGILTHADKSLINLYQRQIQKINKAIENLHEDLQHDYMEELNQLV